MPGLCPCGNVVEPANLFVDVTKGKKFFNAELRCDYAGNKLAEKLDAGEVTVEEVVSDVIKYARKIKSDRENFMLSWFCMHLALGFCYHKRVQDKNFVREILKEILPYSRGIDNGVFYRDLVAFGEDDQQLTDPQKELLDKALYYLKIVSCYKINLRENQFGQKIYGPTYVVKQNFQYYLDLPIGNPAFSQGTAAASTSSPLLNACENLKPHAVLLLLRYGATAHGPVLNYVISQLSSVGAIETAKKSKIRDSPINCTREILKYLLRTVHYLHLRFDEQRIGEMDLEENVYFTSERVKFFLPEEYYAFPNKLKQLCRCKIRQVLRDTGNLPDGCYELPNLITTTKRYIDILG